MKEWICTALLLTLTMTTVSAANTAKNGIAVPNSSRGNMPVNTSGSWMSPNSYSGYSIQTGAKMSITIRVNNGSAGVSLTNCGITGGIAAGSGGVCNVSNPSMPVTITSTSQTAPANGTYQIKVR
jgi:hypothetical protein